MKGLSSQGAMDKSMDKSRGNGYKLHQEKQFFLSFILLEERNFYSENNPSLEQPLQKCSGGFQDAIGWGAK